MNAFYDLAQSSIRREDSVVRITGVARQRERWLFIFILAFTLGMMPMMSYAQGQLGFALTLSALVVAMIIVLMARWPTLGFYMLALCAVVVEQDMLPYPIFTDHLYVFTWPAQFQGLPERPIGFLALFILLVVIVRRVAGRLGAALRFGPLLLPFLFLLATVVMGIVHGLSSGGDGRVIVLEVRPFWYLFLNYLLAYNLVTEKRHVMAFLWITVIGSFIKALQGVYIVLGPLGGHISGQNEIMAHEQSFFFVLVLLLILLCVWLGRLRWLLWVALMSTPFLIIALLANNRRADYAAFLIGAICAWAFVVALHPQRRASLIVGMCVSILVLGIYVLVFQHASGAFAAPANGIVSIIHPSAADVRDLSSNMYRYIEDFDLMFTEKQSPVLGYGFGRPFQQPIALPNISWLDPYYLYIPHNTILWVWMRLGPLGYGALFYLLGAFVVRAGSIARKLRDRDLQLVAIFAIGVVMIEIPLAYGDYQLFFYRNIFYLGLLMGLVMRLPAIDQKHAEQSAADLASEVAELSAARQRHGAVIIRTSAANAQSDVQEPAPEVLPAERAPAHASGAYLSAALRQRR